MTKLITILLLFELIYGAYTESAKIRANNKKMLMRTLSMEDIWDRTKRDVVGLAHFGKRNRIKRYGLPIAFTIFVFFVKHYLHPVLGAHAAFLLVSFIVAASSWYGGLGPGIFATFLAATAAYVLYLSKDITEHPFIGDFIMLGIFTLEGLLISAVSEARYEVEKQKDEFIGFVSHELKNPLAAIKGFTELIVVSVKANKYERVETYANEARNQSDRMVELINDLLDITKIEVGKFTYQDEVFTIDELVKEIIAHQKIISPNRLITVTGHTKSSIVGDTYRIRQAIVNLLTNALKYSPATKKVTLRLKLQRGLIHISVKDYGIGIPRDEQSHIFDRYYRTKNVQKKRSEGLGLGLYITNQIVKHHRGKIWVESDVGKGSTFHITYPANMVGSFDND